MGFSQLLVLVCAFSESLTKLQTYSLYKSLTNSFEITKSGKATTAQINKSLKKHHRYIYWVYHWLGKIHSPQS